MKTVSILKKYSGFVSDDEVAGLAYEIGSALPRFFERVIPRGQVITINDLDWSVATVEGGEDELRSTLYAVRAFGMTDFFAIDELADEDADGNLLVTLSAHLA